MADTRVLPTESVRFFFIDQNWLDALMEGALSVADLDAAHAAVRKVIDGTVGARAAAFARVERQRLRALRRRGGPAPQPEAVDGGEATLWTGLLLRSAAVADWPGLNVRAFDGRDKPLPLLRLDRPCPGVLLAIFDGLAHRVEMAEPPQGLHFGFLGGAEPGSLRVAVRGLGGKVPVAEQIPGRYADVPFRDDAHGRKVVRVGELQQRIRDQIAAAYAPEPPPEVGPGAMALELIVGVQRQPFEHRLPPAPARRPARGKSSERRRARPPAPGAVDLPATVSALIELLRNGR